MRNQNAQKLLEKPFRLFLENPQTGSLFLVPSESVGQRGNRDDGNEAATLWFKVSGYLLAVVSLAVAFL